MNVNDYKIDFENAITSNIYTDKIFDIKKQSFEKFLVLGLPTNKWESWRHTNLSRLNNVKSGLLDSIKTSPKGYKKNNIPVNNLIDIVFYNGVYRKDLSSKLPQGVSISDSLDLLLDDDHLYEGTPFSLLNSTFLKSGITINIDKNMVLDKPIRIIYNSTGNESEIIYPRVILNVNNSASCTFIEHHINNINNSFQNGVTQISMDENSNLNHIKIQKNSPNMIDISSLMVNQKKESNYNFFQYCDGSDLGRNNIHIIMNGNGSNCNLSGISLTKHIQQIDNNIIVEHHGKHTASSQIFKSILDDKSSGVFNGRVIIQEGAVKTDAAQSNKNLILSKNAGMNSNPQMEIYNDDVKCAHGSSTGELDQETLFYMRSRGLDLIGAKSLLIRGFIADLIDNISHEKIKNYLYEEFDNWLNENHKT